MITRQHHRILVVEDDGLIRLDLIDTLEDMGFHVLDAANADEAIRVLEGNADIAAVLTDIDMPGSMNGLNLACAVRDRWPPVKIIITSGHRVVQITDMPDGSVFFSKPYTHVSVISSVREMLA